MPTTRIYYTDAMAPAFDATVISADPREGGAHVVLDRTAFYPTSGGQPFDTGRLGEARVFDVIDGEDGQIVHVTDRPLAVGATVHGEIDWPRRLDHMQQHTGQHILSAAFDRLFGVRTTSFHMSAEYATIDLAREVTPSEIARAEAAANQVVWDDRPVHVRFASAEEASRLPLRKEPVRAGELRLVDVADFDLSACGGTHVLTTGVIGVIAVAGWERFKGATRLTFVCGARALRAYGTLRDVVLGATRAMSVTPDAVVTGVERLQADVKDQGRTIRRLQEELAVFRAADFRARAETSGGYRVVIRAEPGIEAAALKGLASAIVSEPGYVAVLVGDGQPVPVVVASSAGAGLDAGAWLREAAQALGGRGGGRAESAQGGFPADPESIVAYARRSFGVSGN
jgi:alanyl-tRNA synthetase